MNKVTIVNYKESKYYNRIVAIFDSILKKGECISSLIVFRELGLINQLEIDNWKKGKIKYFERVIKCNLNQSSNILRVISFHAHDLNLQRSITRYTKYINNVEVTLQFSKTNESNIEKAYSTIFSKIKKNKI